MRGEWRINLAAFTASLLINGAVVYSFDHAMPVQKASEGPVRFEFVEAPPKTHPAKPRPTHKIASRDALNQDLSPDKLKVSGAPRASEARRADQLAQRQSGASSQGRPGVAPPSEAPRISQGADKRPMPDSQSLPTTQSRGLGGRDRVTTPEATMNVKPTGAQFHGFTSFEATGSGMGAYMKNLKEKVWLAWFAYLSFRYPQDFTGADVVLSFTLDAHGEVKTVSVIDNGGDIVFADYCASAIRRAGGFGDLPKEILAILGKDELEIRCAFHYR